MPLKTNTENKNENEINDNLDTLDASLEIAQALHSVGGITDDRLREYEARREGVKATVRGFDSATLTPVVEFSPEVVKAIRRREGASQALMARHLGVAVQTVGQWERGQRKLEGPAAKLLALVQAHGLQYIR